MICPFIPAAGVIKVEMVYTHDLQVIENVFHVQTLTGEVGLADLEAAAEAWHTWWTNALKALVTETVSLVKIKCTDLTTQDGLTFDYVEGLPSPGTNLGTGFPANVTVAVKWSTAKRGRSYRGRTYHVGLADTMLTGLNHLSTAATTQIQTAYNALIGTYATDVGTLVVVSYRHNNACRETAWAEPILTASVNTTLDSQRRRLPERGR